MHRRWKVSRLFVGGGGEPDGRKQLQADVVALIKTLLKQQGSHVGVRSKAYEALTKATDRRPERGRMEHVLAPTQDHPGRP